METNKEIKEVEEKCLPVVAEANAITVKNEADLEVAKNMVRSLRDLGKEVKATFDPIVTKANETHKAATQARKKHLDPIDTAKRAVEGTIGVYADKLREAARVEEQRLEKEKAREIEVINRRMEKHLAGFKDIEGQITALEEKLAKHQTTAVECEIVSNQLEALIRKRDLKAQTVENNQSQMQQVETRTSQAPETSTVMKGAGGGKQERIPTVFNKEAFVKAIAEGQIPVDLVDINEGKLKKYVNNFPTIRLVGVKIDYKTKVSVR